MIVHDDLLQQAAAQVLDAEMVPEIVEGEFAESGLALAAATEEVGSISRNVETYGAVAESMESYVTRFMDTVPVGEWNRKTSRQYEIGMQAILSTVGVSMESVAFSPSFESSTTQTNDENRAETKTKSEGLVKRMWEAFKAMLASFVESIGKFASMFKNHAGAVKNLGIALRRKAATTSGKSEKDEMPGGAFSLYLQDDGIELQPVSAVDTFSKLMMSYSKEWSEQFLSAAEEICFNKTMSGGGPNPEIVLDGKVTLGTIKDAQTFPGGYTVTMSSNTYGTAKIESAKSGAAEGPVKVLSLGEVKNLGDALFNMGTDMERSVTQLNQTVVSIKRISTELKMDKAEKLSPSVVSKLLGKVTMANRLLLPMASDVAKGAYTHGIKSLAQYK